MRKFFSAILIAALLLVPQAAFAAETKTMRVDEYGITVDFPSNGDGWMFFGRDTAADDPNLAVIGSDSETLLKNFTKNKIFFNTVKDDMTGEFILACEKTDNSSAIHNYNLMDEDSLKKELEGVVSADYSKKLEGLKYLKYDIIQGEQATFTVLDGSITVTAEDAEDTVILFTQYNTVVNGISINASYHGYNGQVPDEARQMLSHIAQSMKWDEIVEGTYKENALPKKTKVLLGIIAVLGLLLIPNIRHYKKQRAKNAAEYAAQEAERQAAYAEVVSLDEEAVSPDDEKDDGSGSSSEDVK